MLQPSSVAFLFIGVCEGGGLIFRCPKLGHVWTSHKHHVRFLLRRPEFHLFLRTSQRSNLRRRLGSRATHGTCPVLSIHQERGFCSWQMQESVCIGSARYDFYPPSFPVEPANRIQFAMYSASILSHRVKSGTGEMPRKRNECPCFQKLVISLSGSIRESPSKGRPRSRILISTPCKAV